MNKKREHIFIESLIEGYILLIPLIFICVVISMILNFPMEKYREFILSDGMKPVYDVLMFFFGTIWNWFGIFVVVAVSWSYGGHALLDRYQRIILVFAALVSYFFIAGVGVEQTTWIYLSNQGLFSAVLALFLSCTLYKSVNDRIGHIFEQLRLSRQLTASIRNMIPLSAVIFFSFLMSYVVWLLSGGRTLQDVVSEILSHSVLLLHKGSPLFAALLYQFFCMGFWFFGIHGQNLLYEINDGFYANLLAENMTVGADHIINTTFLNTFAMFGGSGCLLALTIVILESSKNRTTRTVAKLGALPGIFNMGEVLTFGLPIAFNRKLVVPFILAPMMNTFLAYVATALHLVPVVRQSVHWTTPIFVSGYLATGEFSGLFLQMLLLGLDVALYWPFVKKYDEFEKEKFISGVRELEAELKAAEEQVREIRLTEIPGRLGETAKTLMVDLRHDLQEKKLYMLYQPQYNKKEDYMGAEALLRWEHETVGFVYPPMIIKLAMEGDFLYELEEFVFDITCRGIRLLEDLGGIPCKVSANITGSSAMNPNFVKMVDDAVERHGINPTDLWIELTEQAVMNTSTGALANLSMVREHGHKLLIDDFSMGHTSISYLKTELFDGIKLDGTITRHVLTDEKDRQIISSVAKMCEGMNMILIAEYVEEEDQKELLKELGGDAFQGYLYSKPLSLPEMLEFVEQKNKEKIANTERMC